MGDTRQDQVSELHERYVQLAQLRTAGILSLSDEIWLRFALLKRISVLTQEVLEGLSG